MRSRYDKRDEDEDEDEDLDQSHLVEMESVQ